MVRVWAEPIEVVQDAARRLQRRSLTTSCSHYLNYINFLSNNNTSNYNSLQTSLTQRTQYGLSYVLGYTYSHSISQNPDNWSFFNPIQSQNLHTLSGNSMFDIRHHFTASVTYMIPGKKTKSQLYWMNLTVNTILLLQTGAPWGVNDVTTDFSGTNEINQPASIGEQWNFYGNPKDFQTSKALNNTSGGATGIPLFRAQ